MENYPFFLDFIAQRQRFYAEFDRIRGEVEDWLERHSAERPSVLDLAQLESLHSQRASLIAEYQALEDGFIEAILKLSWS